MTTESKEVHEVIDKTTDRWIRVLGIFAGVTMFLVGAIGYLVNDKMDTSNLVLEEIRKGVNAVNLKTENNSGRISSVESDVKEIRDVQTDYGKRIYKLEGVKNGR